MKWIALLLIIGMVSPSLAVDADDLLLYDPTQEFIDPDEIEDIYEKLKDVIIPTPYPFPLGPIAALR